MSSGELQERLPWIDKEQQLVLTPKRMVIVLGIVFALLYFGTLWVLENKEEGVKFCDEALQAILDNPGDESKVKIFDSSCRAPTLR